MPTVAEAVIVGLVCGFVLAGSLVLVLAMTKSDEAATSPASASVAAQAAPATMRSQMDVGVGNGATPDGAVPVAGPGVILFHANWCGHCKAMAGETDAIAQGLAAAKIPFYRIEASDKRPFAYKVVGFPTINYYPDVSKPDDYTGYDGARKAADIVAWAKQCAKST
jgi:thiol-disulfide isomerase/thioredoxin